MRQTVSEPIADPASDEPDGSELTVLTAIRSWLRPHCDAWRAPANWKEILRAAGLRPDGLEHFDLLMRSLALISIRPLDMRCRCASELARNEASLLQALALLQRTRNQAAVLLLGEWLPQPAVSGLLKLARWLAIDLLDAGLELRAHPRAFTYLH